MGNCGKKNKKTQRSSVGATAFIFGKAPQDTYGLCKLSSRFPKVWDFHDVCQVSCRFPVVSLGRVPRPTYRASNLHTRKETQEPTRNHANPRETDADSCKIRWETGLKPRNNISEVFMGAARCSGHH